MRSDSPFFTRQSHSFCIDVRNPMSSSSLNGWCRLEHPAEDLVEPVGVDTGEREPPRDVDVARAVDGVRERPHPQVPAQEEAVVLGVVLVRVADDERGHRQVVLTHPQRDHGLQLLLPRQGDDDLAVPAAGLPRQLGLVEVLLQQPYHPLPLGPGHRCSHRRCSRLARSRTAPR